MKFYIFFFLDKLGILRKINKLFQKNYSSLGDRHSVTQLLDAWVCKKMFIFCCKNIYFNFFFFFSIQVLRIYKSVFFCFFLLFLKKKIFIYNKVYVCLSMLVFKKIFLYCLIGTFFSFHFF
jgi:hypothetical protein